MNSQKDGAVENYYKFFKDESWEEDLMDEDREVLTSEMKDILGDGDGDGLEKMLLAASTEGFSYLAGYQSSVTTSGQGAQDAPHDDEDDDEVCEATEHLAYKFVGRELFVQESPDPDDLKLQ